MKSLGYTVENNDTDRTSNKMLDKVRGWRSRETVTTNIMRMILSVLGPIIKW